MKNKKVFIKKEIKTENSGNIKFVTLPEAIKSVENKKDALFLILDELTDVQNVGAVIRTAVAGGVDFIVISKHNQAPINETVIKTSAYTAQMIPIVVSNINQAVRTLQKNKFWIYGLTMNAPKTIWQTDLKGKVGAILGSESDGIHKSTIELCDFEVSIPMDPKVESLNVSVSGALFVYERLRQIN